MITNKNITVYRNKEPINYLFRIPRKPQTIRAERINQYFQLILRLIETHKTNFGPLTIFTWFNTSWLSKLLIRKSKIIQFKFFSWQKLLFLINLGHSCGLKISKAERGQKGGTMSSSSDLLVRKWSMPLIQLPSLDRRIYDHPITFFSNIAIRTIFY